MKRLLTLIPALALAGLVMATPGCGKKKDGAKKSGGSDFNCDTITAKNKKCGNELAEAFLGDMKLKPEMKGKLMERMKQSFASDRFKDRCKKNWDSDKPRDKKMKDTLKKCFSISDCKEFAACFAKSMKSGRRMRRGMRPGMGHVGHDHKPGDMH